MKNKTLPQIIKLFREKVAEAGGQTQWAKLHSISTSYVCDIWHVRKEPGEKILDALGYERVEPTYREKSK